MLTRKRMREIMLSRLAARRAAGASKKNVPKKLKNIDKKIKKMQNDEELKYTDVLITAQGISSTGSFHLLNGLTQGDDAKNRDGREAVSTSIQGKMTFVSNTDDIGSTTLRMIVFWDSQANGAAPTAATLLDNSIITSFLIAPYHRDYQKRYKILFDRVFVLNPLQILTTTAGTVTENQNITKYLSFKKQLSRTIKFNSNNNGNIGDIVSNSLYVYFVSNEATNTPTVTSGFRFYYKD